MARKFKKKTVSKKIRVKERPVLSVNLIGKEYFDKLRELFKRLYALTNNRKRVTKN